MTDAVGLGKDLPRFFSTWDEVLPGAGGHRPSRRGGSFRSAGGPEGPWGPGSLGWQVQGAQEVTKDPRGTSLLSRSAAPSKRAPGPGSGSTSETRAWNQLQPPGQTLCLRKGNRTSTQMSSSRHRPPPVVYYRLRSLCRPPSSRGGTLRTSMLTGLGPQRASFVSCWLLWSPRHTAPASPRRVPGSSLTSPAVAACRPLRDVASVAPAGTCWLRGTRSRQRPVVCLDSGEQGCVPQRQPLDQQPPSGGPGRVGANPSVWRGSSLGALAEHRAPIPLPRQRVRAPDPGPRGTSLVSLGFCGFTVASGARGSY